MVKMDTDTSDQGCLRIRLAAHWRFAARPTRVQSRLPRRRRLPHSV